MRTRPPKYRLHRGTGQALVCLKGRRIYLGRHGTEQSREKYRRLVAEWLSNDEPEAPPPSIAGLDQRLTLTQICVRYWRFAKGHYTKDGRRTGECYGIRAALKEARSLYGRLPAEEFGPKALKAVRDKLVRDGMARKSVNQYVGRIKRMFAWTVEEELLPVAVHQALLRVRGLRAGKTAAVERPRVLPADDDDVERTLPFLPAVVRDMVRFERLTGCRPGEVCTIRRGDVDTSGEVWVAKLEAHKTAHHGHERRIYIGPRAQEVLRPYLLRPAEANCFSPIESERKRRRDQRAARKSPVQPSQANRAKRSRRRPPQAGYTKDSYNRAVRRAIDRANDAEKSTAEAEGRKPNPIERWRPNQLRHARATEIRRDFGLEAAQVILGHRRADVTQVYAERDLAKAVKVAREVG